MRASLEQTGSDISNADNVQRTDRSNEAKAWSGIWGAGQGVHIVHEVSTVADLVAKLRAEYEAA